MRQNSELEQKIRSVILHTLNLKITDNGLQPDTSAERINQGIKQMTEWMAEMLKRERNNTLAQMSYKPKRHTIINDYRYIYGRKIRNCR